MRFDHQKAFPYPVLRPDINDYIDGEFQVTVDVETSGAGEVVFTSHFALSVPQIASRIEQGTASYVLVIACRDTYFRDAIKTQDSHVKKVYSGDVLHGEVLIYPFIVARQEISDFSSPDINSEFGCGPFSYTPGEVLAADEPRAVYLHRDLFKPISSVFELVVKDSITGFEYQLNLDSERVQIQLSAKAEETIDAARNATKNKAVLINSLYFSAVMQAVQALKDGSDQYSELKWAKVLLSKCHNMSLDLQHHDSYVLAQRLMHYPLELLAQYVFYGGEQ